MKNCSNHKPKILMCYIESGIGHITSMRSINDSLNKLNDNRAEVIETSIMQHSEVTAKYEKWITSQVKNTNSIKGFGDLMFIIIRMLGGQTFQKVLNHSLFKRPTDELVKQIATFNPDIIVSTHYFITYCAIEYRNKFNPNAVVFTYNPDTNIHPWWDRRGDYFFVNNENAKEEAVKKQKFSPETIQVVNFTKRQALINTTLPKRDYRVKYNLPLDKFTVILADGAYAMGKSKAYAEALFETDLPLTVLYIAGKNEKMLNYMLEKKQALLAAGKENITLEVYPFQPDIHELYRAADLFITKAGPNSILDSLFMGTPVCVNLCPHPIEKASYEYFVKSLGCGIGVFKANKIREVVEDYIQTPQKLQPFIDNIQTLNQKKNGADDIAEFILSLAVEKYTQEENGDSSS